jgi:hypothetical protein
LLYGRRKRQADLAAREAAGESFWTDEFEQRARAQIVHALRDAAGDFSEYYKSARGMILRDEGMFCLVDHRLAAGDDLIQYVMRCADEDVPTVIEAVLAALTDPYTNHPVGNAGGAKYFELMLTVILREHRISYELSKGQMIPFSARELHESTVSPAVTLLAGRPDLEKVESAYREALEEISKGKAADAITDVGTAMQEMLSSLGCEGNALGAQIASARAKGILAPHDSPMLTVMEKVLHWVSADRSEKGDAHAVTSPTLDDAWFIVHIVGAAILRLSKSPTRATQ